MSAEADSFDLIVKLRKEVLSRTCTDIARLVGERLHLVVDAAYVERVLASARRQWHRDHPTSVGPNW